MAGMPQVVELQMPPRRTFIQEKQALKVLSLGKGRRAGHGAAGSTEGSPGAAGGGNPVWATVKGTLAKYKL